MSKAVSAVSSVVSAVTKPAQKVFGLLMPKVPNPAGSGMTGSELKQVIRSSKEPARYVFGHVGTGALLAWAQEEPGDQDEGEELYLIYVLTEGAIESLDEIYINQEPVATAGELIEYELVSGPTAPNAYMLEHSPDWRDTMIGRGLTYVRMTLKYDPEFFASGIPDVLFEYRARNDVYDPRTDASGYSDNAALVILWYVRNRLRVPDDEILWDTFIDAANICDEPITNPNGSVERRYAISGGFRADERKDRVQADLMAACAGSLLRVGGKIGLQVGAYYGPAEFTIDEDMIVGAVTGQTETSRADAVNTMRGTFISREQRWVETDYPAVSVAEWVEEDGGQIEDSLNLRFVSSPYRAQRLANIELRRKRAGGRLELPLNFRGYACRPGRVVRVELPSLNISGEFAVVDWDFSGENGCKVKLRAEQPEIYDDAVGQPFDVTNFIRLPTGGIGSPTGLRYVVESVGEVVQGLLLWNPVDAALHYNVVIKHDGQAVQSAQVPAGVERCEIGGLVSGNYTAEVRARGRLGQSGPASITFSISAPPMPERVRLEIGNREITLIPFIAPGASLNGGHYRFYFTQNPNASQAQSDLLGEGLTFTHTGLAPQQTYYYYVQSVNAYGSSPFLRVEAVTTLKFDEEWQWLEEQLRAPGGIVDQFENEIDHLGDTVAEANAQIDAAVDSANAALDEARAALDASQGFESGIEDAQAQAASALERAQAALDTADNVAQRVTDLGTEFDDATAQITQQISALATETDALTELYNNLSSELGETTAEFDQRISALATQTESVVQSVESLESDLNGMNAQIEETRQTIVLNQLAQATINTAMQARAALGAAAIDVERNVRVDEDRALAELITRVETEFGNANSSFEERITSLSDASQALTQQLTTLRSEFEDSEGLIEETRQSIAMAEMAQAVQNLALRARTSSGNAALDVENIVRQDETSSLSTRIIELSTDYQGNKADVRQQLTAFSSEQESIASSLTQLDTRFENNRSSVNDQLISVSSAQSATAGRLSRFEVEVDGEIASVHQDVSAVYDPRTGAVARAVTTVNANGRQGVLGIQVNGRNSEIIGIADQFAILNTVNNQLVTAFVVRDGRVVIPDALIRDASISNAKIVNGSIDNAKLANAAITAAKIANGEITNAKIANAAINSAKIANAAVGTLTIQGEAVTAVASTTTNGGVVIAPANGWVNVQSLLVTRNDTGSPVSILGVAYVTMSWNIGTDTLSQTVRARLWDATSGTGITLDGTVLSTPSVGQYSGATPIVLMGNIPSNWSNRQVVMQVAVSRVAGSTASSANCTVNGRSLQATTTKR
ncbi:phage tail tip fiber protein [Vreelandella sp. GE22]